jgi:lysozyme family protein
MSREHLDVLLVTQFDAAFAKVMGHEGSYVHDPKDRGGETYKGIARKHWPDWAGWAEVDRVKQLYLNPASISRQLDKDKELQVHVKAFYAANFWTPIAADAVFDASKSPAFVIEYFDAAVNHGVGWAQRNLQQTLNILNRDQAIYRDVLADSKVGPRTLKCLKRLVDNEGTHQLRLWYVILRGSFYTHIIKGDPSQERFARGWASRLHITLE